MSTVAPKLREKTVPSVPEFIVGIKSPSDKLTNLQERMVGHLDSGLRVHSMRACLLDECWPNEYTVPNLMITRIVAGLCVLGLVGCSAPKSDIPALNPELAYGLLQNDNKAKNWLETVRKENPGCAYHVELPDQLSHPAEVDLDHIVQCGTKPAPRSLDASVVFTYDKAAGHWVIGRFSS